MKRTSLYYRLILAAALLAWCSGTAHAELRVVTTVKPIHSLVASVMGGIGKPYLIVKGAASPHTYAMKPSDAAALQNAQVIFRVGGPFERFLEAAIKNGNASANVVSMSDISNVRRLPYRTGQAWGTAKHHHHGHKHDSKEDFDPHIWLDPHNALQMVGAIAQTLGLEQPSRMFDFARNAAAVAARIKDLQAATEATVGPIRNRPFLVFHDAFQYFENAFNIRAIGAVSLGESRSPGARRIKTLRREIAARKVVCVFAEPQFEPQIIATLIEGTAVRRGVLDPIGARIRAGPDAYFQMMQSNANALVSCLR